MIHINFELALARLTEEQKQEWENWQKKAEAATERAIQAWEQWRAAGSPGKFAYTFEEKVWGELKEWLVKNVFHDKCAYCETREVRSPYHAEHFRPKGRVRFREEGKKRWSTALTMDEQGVTIEHPGYFWLAYHWINLLPSCNDCNTARGKNDQFPVRQAYISVKRLTEPEVQQLRQQLIQSKLQNDIFYLQPEDLNALEDPLLLHPYLDNPEDHLVFGEFGVVAPRDGSEKGQHSIMVYNLAAENLRIARQVAQESVLKEYTNEFIRGRNLSKQGRIQAAKASIAAFIEGEEPYSSAVLGCLRIYYPDHNL